MEKEEITEEQRKRAEANRAAALAKRKAILSITEQTTHPKNHPWKLFKCRKLSPEATANFSFPKQPIIADSTVTGQKSERFRVRLEICSPDSFSVTPVAVEGFVFPGEGVCFERLSDCLSNVVLSHYTQNTGGGKACVYKLYDYHSVLRPLKNCTGIECEEIPWGTFNVVERLSHSFIAGKWIPCRPEHLPDEKVDELIAELPKLLLNSLLPFQLDGVRFGLRRGGSCLIADEMGLGKTLQSSITISIRASILHKADRLVSLREISLKLLPPSSSGVKIRIFTQVLKKIHEKGLRIFGHQDNPARLAKLPRVVVISYTMLRRLQSSMLEQEWVTLIVDESHHLHCNKKSSEKDELKVVLDVATKVKHLILLSGTPSLSRPGLLGQNKYEFAKTYCSVKFVRGCQGKVFQDFSKGIRLEELNVLLKQSVMIRRLKEHVLLQLPPKRRQIIKLVLRRSDINSAMETLGLENVDASTDNNAENAPLHVSDEVVKGTPEERGAQGARFRAFPTPRQAVYSDMNKKLSKKLSALGLAKLPGFFEWLSIHPIMVEVDGEETTGESSSSHKMIIFAYHHKVLDGVQDPHCYVLISHMHFYVSLSFFTITQAFLCEKRIQFVRIDCTVTGNDRQSAIQSFQSSKEVKIALIGIRAGSSGLNLTSADNVVFLELPMTPGDIQQAEDRAHRHGQKRLVNVYIFCAKDTSDELQWQQLNRSLLRVSSTVNGKHDAIQEIKNSSAWNTSSDTASIAHLLGLEYIMGTFIPIALPAPPHLQRALIEASQPGETSDLLQRRNRWGGWISMQGDHDSQLPRASCDTLVKVNKVGGEQHESETTLNGDGCGNKVEFDMNNSIRSTSLRFEVSQHTGRIHLYSCIPGTNSRPRPLFKNFRQEEVECRPLAEKNERTSDKSIEDNSLYMEALMAFIKEWKELRPIEKRKLMNKPLQLPLSYELCYLNESLNHDNEGLLRGGSKRRKTPMADISYPLPSNAAWRKVNLYSGHGQKEKFYTHGWSDMDEPLCKLCQTPCKGNNAKVPQYFEDLFCNLDCFEEYRSRTSNRFLREELFKIEHGICTNCQLNCHRLVKDLKVLSLEKRQAYITKVAPKIAKRSKLLDKLVHDPIEGNAWHADHIIPVYKGGGECKLDNLRTLCVACHADVTTAQCLERRNARYKAKKQLKETLSGLINVKSGKIDNVLQDLNFQSKEMDHDLLIEIPEPLCSGSSEAPTIANSKKRCQELENPCDPAESAMTGERESEEWGKLSNSAKPMSPERGEALEATDNGQRDEENLSFCCGYLVSVLGSHHLPPPRRRPRLAANQVRACIRGVIASHAPPSGFRPVSRAGAWRRVLLLFRHRLLPSGSSGAVLPSSLV
ncbi:hypothetical protein DH2020_038103 [Rehmannia glutinosa]|uniref:DNA annealing helicase and endonuclease ZRANB3 n=1 Tax=Rehmannia glutinosa TaxID=99300 RepID=A0ABR0UZI6_REHGL